MPEDIGGGERGIIDGADRMLKELIRTPRFKETVTILLKSVDPPAARSLVRTLFWEDPVLFMSLFGVLPGIANALIAAAAEAVCQLGVLPPKLLEDFVDRLASGVDAAALGEAAAGLAVMATTLDLGEGGVVAESLGGLKARFLEGYREKAPEISVERLAETVVSALAKRAAEPGSAVNRAVNAAGEAISSNPEFSEHVVAPLLDSVRGVPAAAVETGREAAGKKAGKPAAKKARKPARKRAGGKATGPAGAAERKPAGKKAATRLPGSKKTGGGQSPGPGAGREG